MDLVKWQPFTFEIMLNIGAALGTKHYIFKTLFEQNKAYLMGKVLTIETMLTKIEKSTVPSN